MTIFDYSIYIPWFFGGLIFLAARNDKFYKKSTAPKLKKYLVDFMNPNLPTGQLEAIMNALETPKSWYERICVFLFGWIDNGLYTKQLPKQEKLEEMIAKYFKEDAPKIRALPSYQIHYPSETSSWKLPTPFKIISQDENRKAGFFKVPCPNLFEYPEESIHKSEYMFDDEWGNVKGKEL